MEKDHDFNLVIDAAKEEEAARKARNSLIGLTTSALALMIVTGTILYNNHVEKIVEEASAYENSVDNKITYKDNSTENSNSIVDEDINETEVTNNDIDQENYVTTQNNGDFSFGDKEIDYSNVDSFFNEIVENRGKYGNFAESFQSKEDVINLINFFYLFDETYEVESSINSQELFDQMIKDYYSSCVKHDIEPKLNTLFKADSLMAKKFREMEALAYDLKNGSGTDYTISNNYYTWYGVNLVDKRTAIPENMKYAPYIRALRVSFEEYRYVGNMLNARKYQKNDSLPIEKTDVYYSHQYNDGTEVNEIHNSFSCPDGIDNFVSIPENIEETKWILSDDGSLPFEKVDYYFDYILNKRRVR